VTYLTPAQTRAFIRRTETIKKKAEALFSDVLNAGEPETIHGMQASDWLQNIIDDSYDTIEHFKRSREPNDTTHR